MAAVVIPGQPRRWGNESTNFFQHSSTVAPGVASRQKVYRCDGNQYTNCGHYHLGTKAVNLKPPLDVYGTPVAYKLRADDQRLPRALTAASVQSRPMSSDRPVNMYQSHRQRYHSYAMSSPQPLTRSHSEQEGGTEALTRSLNQAFYTTSYQSNITKYADLRRPQPRPKSATLCETLQSRRNSLTGTPQPSASVCRPRTPSAPLMRPTNSEKQPTLIPPPPLLQRRRSFSAIQRSYPSKGEMLKEIFITFPSPQPQAASKWQGRPSSAVTLRAGKIPRLRKAEAWI